MPPGVNQDVPHSDVLRAFFDTALDAIVVTDSGGRVALFNQAAERLFGMTAVRAIGQPVSALMPFEFSDQDGEHRTSLGDVHDSSTIGIYRTVYGRHSSGARFPVEIALSRFEIDGAVFNAGVIRSGADSPPVASRHGRLLDKLVSTRTAELEAAVAEFERLSHTDALTGLANRRAFDKTLLAEINRASRKQLPLSLLLCDVDYFKRFNDLYGHADGDDCLKKISLCISQTTKRNYDLAARYGGEEFALILPTATAPDAAVRAAELCERVRALDIRHAGSESSDRVTVCVGVAGVVPSRAFSARALVEEADKQLYRAKASGRDGYSTIDLDHC